MKLGILISGRGSNMVALVDAVQSGEIPDSQVSVVISNRADAAGLVAGFVGGRGIQRKWLRLNDFEQFLTNQTAVHVMHDDGIIARVEVAVHGGFVRREVDDFNRFRFFERGGKRQRPGRKTVIRAVTRRG